MTSRELFTQQVVSSLKRAEQFVAGESTLEVSKHLEWAAAYGPPFANGDDDGVGRSLGTHAILSPSWHGVNT